MTKNLDKEGLSSIVDDYQLFYVDLWGVVHNGVHLHNEAIRALNEITKKRLLITSGIAQPKGFERLIEQQGIESIAKIKFPDHHDYRREDVQKILEEQQKLKPDYMLTTEKDAVKLRNFAELGEKIWVIEMEMIPDKLWNDFFSEFLRDTFETPKNK